MIGAYFMTVRRVAVVLVHRSAPAPFTIAQARAPLADPDPVPAFAHHEPGHPASEFRRDRRTRRRVFKPRFEGPFRGDGVHGEPGQQWFGRERGTGGQAAGKLELGDGVAPGPDLEDAPLLIAVDAQ